MGIVDFFDLVGFLGFTAALAILASVPSRADGRFTSLTKAFSLAAFGVYSISLGAEVFGLNADGSFIEELEDFIEILFPFFVLMAVISSYSAQQMLDVRRAQRGMKASHDLMFGIVEAAPAGIMLLDPIGRITFANETAREVLDLTDDPQTGDLLAPGWTVRDQQGRGRPDFREIAGGASMKHNRVTVEWPGGWTVVLDVHVEPIGSSSGAPGALVATFERPQRSPGI